MKNNYIIDLLIGIIFTIFFMSAAVLLTLHCRSLYYKDIDMLNLEKETLIDKNVLIENYDVLIDYCTTSSIKELKLPNFSSSKEGLQHFKEVKDLFSSTKNICIVTFIFCIGIIIYKTRKREFHYLFVTSGVTICIPLFLTFLVITNFEHFFENFHKLFFDNDYYLFDPKTDPIITILPADYFMHCGILILLFSILCGGCLFIIWRELDKRYIVVDVPPEEAS